LPDGIFSNPFGKILDSFGMEKVGMFYGHLEYILMPFGAFNGYLVI
jgi:hypothetical protein